jgi:cytochrome c oxidase subunit 2
LPHGPDLTHLGGRQTLAAGALDNSQENLARWIENPQHYKPAVLMPRVALTDQQVREIVAFLWRP